MTLACTGDAPTEEQSEWMLIFLDSEAQQPNNEDQQLSTYVSLSFVILVVITLVSADKAKYR